MNYINVCCGGCTGKTISTAELIKKENNERSQVGQDGNLSGVKFVTDLNNSSLHHKSLNKSQNLDKFDIENFKVPKLH